MHHNRVTDVDIYITIYNLYCPGYTPLVKHTIFVHAGRTVYMKLPLKMSQSTTHLSSSSYSSFSIS